MLKLFSQIWRSEGRLTQKLEATFHLGGNLAYLVMVIDSLFFLVPSLIARQTLDWTYTIWIDVFMLLLSSGGHLFFFIAGQLFSGNALARTLRFVPVLLSTGVGLAINDARAVMEALVGHETEFVRTPKRGEDQLNPIPDQASEKAALQSSELQGKRPTRFKPTSVRPELPIGILYGIVALWACMTRLWVAVPFLFLLHVGFLSNGIHRWREHRRATLEART